MDIDHASNADLLSSIAGKKVAGVLLRRYGSMRDLANASFDELTHVPGVGPSKAAAIRSAFLIARRLARETYADSPVLDTPDRVADLLREEYRGEPIERLHAVLLNTRRRLIAVSRLATGTQDTLLIHPRELFHAAVTKRASAIVLAHNHPSGDPTPSEADIRLTRDMVRAGQLMKIEVLDHIIIGQLTPARSCDYVSLRELGYFAA